MDENRRGVVRVPVLLGPTAAGKTALSLALCEELGWDVISCDSRQVYRGMDIGTAKPTLHQRRRVKHHLVDILTPDVPYSAWLFAADASRVLASYGERACRGMICGGTGFYFEALSQGLNLHAPPCPHLRRQLCEQAKREGAHSIFEELKRRDPARAASLHPNDVQRVVRAIELAHAVAGVGARGCSAVTYRFDVAVVVLPREELYRRIDERVNHMFSQGLWDEFRGLREAGYGESSPGLASPGYRELFAVEQGVLSLAQAGDLVKRNTRRFAKRQLTWYRTRVQAPVFDLSGGGEGEVRSFFLSCSSKTGR